MQIKNSAQGGSLSLTAVIPVYNEAATIAQTLEDFYEKVVKKYNGSRLLIAEDGSTDGTKEVLVALNKKIPFVMVSSGVRKGYTRVFKDLLKAADGELVFFSDSDGQHDPGDFFKLLAAMEDKDVVSGRRCRRFDPRHRLIISAAYNFLVRALFGIGMRDINSGFKLIRKEVIDAVLNDVRLLDYCVMTEFMLRARRAGFAIGEVCVSHRARPAKGKSRIFSAVGLPRIMFKVMFGLWRLSSELRGNKR